MVVIPDREPEIFVAICHPARRRMLDLRFEADRSANMIAGHFPMSRPAVSQHRYIFLDAGLGTEQRRGRERHDPVPRAVRSGAGWDRALRAVLG
jgi:DNA-binding transcriptional ArsR family regulator